LIETKTHYLEDLEVGMRSELSAVVDEKAVLAFAELTGDHNPVHVDEEFAKTTAFGGRIAHGALTASYISAILGNQLPGAGAIFTGMELRFRRPVMVGSEVVASAEVAEINEKTRRVTMKVKCLANGKPAVSGVAHVVVPRRDPA